MPYGDTDTGYALMSCTDMQKAGLSDSSVVQITAAKSSCLRVRSSELEPGHIALDGIARANIETGIGEMISVFPRECPEATAVTLAVVQGTAPHILDVLKPSSVKERLCGRVVGDGDTVGVRVFSSRAALTVLGVAPRPGPVSIGHETEVSLAPSDAESRPFGYTTYEDIGGLDVEVERIREMVEMPMRHPDLFDRFGIDPPRGLLLYGPPGTGKTLIARALSSQLQAHFIHIDGPEVMHKYYGETERQLRDLFAEARRRAPSIIFIDEIDALAPKRSVVIGDVEKRAVAQILTLMDGMNDQSRVMVIGATNMPELLDPALRRSGRFDREIFIGPPNAAGRREILQIRTRNMPLSPDVDLDILSTLTTGFVGADLEILCKEAGMAALRREVYGATGGRTVEMADFLSSMNAVQTTASRVVRFERSRFTLKDVVGMGQAKERLRFIIGRALVQRTDALSAKAILLHGPAGCGKSLLARALAGEVALKYLEVTPAQVFSAFPERAIEDLFKTSRRSVPCLLFFNNIDSFVTHQVRGSSLEAQLKFEIESSSRVPGFVLIASTSRRESLSGLLASGFDVEMEVGLPGIETRRLLVEKGLLGLPLDGNLDMDEIARRTEGRTSAQVLSVCRQAALTAAAGRTGDGTTDAISQRHFELLEKGGAIVNGEK
jgi:transitional endoplasmic reticulum ATPase